MKRRFFSLLLILALALGASTTAGAVKERNLTVVQTAAGASDSFAVTADGTLWQWSAASPSPTEVLTGVQSVSHAGGFSEGGHAFEPVTFAVTKDGRLLGWGGNDFSQLGQGDCAARLTPDGRAYSTVPILDHVKTAAAGTFGGAAITEDGSLWLWGLVGAFTGYVPLEVFTGSGLTDDFHYSASPEKLLTDVRDVRLTPNQVLALRTDGTVWLLGSMNGDFYKSFTKIAENVTDIAMGEGVFLLVKDGGELVGWGENASCQLARTGEAALPVTVLQNVRSVTVSGDGKAVYAVKTDGSLVGWGLLPGRTAPVTSPVQLDSGPVASVSASQNRALYVKNGVLWGFGQLEASAVPLEKPVRTGVSVTPFGDVSNADYFFEPIRWAVDGGVTNGTAPETFSPHESCTRAQIVTFLWRAAGSPAPSRTATVSDVEPGLYYSDAVSWAAERGLFTGSEFRPHALCTRAVAVEFLWKCAGSPSDVGTSVFTDVPANASYAAAVAWAVQAGVTTGVSDTSFAPDAPCSRGQIVTFLYRAFA